MVCVPALYEPLEGYKHKDDGNFKMTVIFDKYFSRIKSFLGTMITIIRQWIIKHHYLAITLIMYFVSSSVYLLIGYLSSTLYFQDGTILRSNFFSGKTLLNWWEFVAYLVVSPIAYIAFSSLYHIVSISITKK